MRTILLDNEAVTALADPTHRKHRVVLAHLTAVVARRRKGAATRTAVPTAVRVEAGWDRSSPTASAINRFRVADAVLDASAADLAAEIVNRTGVSVADAHVGAVIRALAAEEEAVVLTSDPKDMVVVSAPKTITAIRI